MFRRKLDIILERPIENKKEDFFGILPYAKQLKRAMSKGARFIAINGAYGSGKSSLWNVLQKELGYSCFKKYIVVNSLNVQNMEQYHRYFINQVANDLLCDDPYEMEKTFYKKTFEYTTVKRIKNKYLRIFIDKLLLFSFSIFFVNNIFLWFFKNIIETYNLTDLMKMISPISLIVSFVLIIIYGYGFNKPEEEKNLDLNEIDKCRTNFLKTLSDNVYRDSTVYIVIEDLDRIKNPTLQKNIIAMLYNEYYSLDEKIKNIKIKFIFMLNLKNDETTENTANNNVSKQTGTTTKNGCLNDIDYQKMFDYIVDISNNQKNIVKNFLNISIEKNEVLKNIFNNMKVKNYIIGIIIKNYTDMRSIKHFLNKIIIRNNYIVKKKLKNFKINFDELVFLCYLTDLYLPEEVASFSQAVLDKNDEGLEGDLKVLYANSEIKKIFDINYNIYIYNFINQKDLLNINELNILDFISEISDKEIVEMDVEKYKKLVNNVVIDNDKIYESIYFLQSNKIKQLMLISRSFSQYLINEHEEEYEKIEFKDFYKIFFANDVLNNIKNNISNIKNVILYSIITTKKIYFETNNEENYEKLKTEIFLFINCFKENIILFKDVDIFSNLRIDEKIFEALNLKVNNNTNLLCTLYFQDQIKYDQISEFINIEYLNYIRTELRDCSLNFEKSIINENIPDAVFLNIVLYNENSDPMFIEKFLSKEKEIDVSLFSIEKLFLLIEKYKYNEKIDKYLFKFFNEKNNRISIYNFLNKKEIKMSKSLLEEINKNNDFYEFNDFNLKQFHENKIFEMVIRTRSCLTKEITLDEKEKDEEVYIKAILNIFDLMTRIDYANYKFSNICKKIICKKYDWNKIIESTLWKLVEMSSCIKIDKFKIIIEKLHFDDKFNKFTDEYLKLEKQEYSKLEYLYNNCDKRRKISLKHKMKKINK